LHVVLGLRGERPSGLMYQKKYPEGLKPAAGRRPPLRFTLAQLTQQGREIRLSRSSASNGKQGVSRTRIWNANALRG